MQFKKLFIEKKENKIKMFNGNLSTAVGKFHLYECLLCKLEMNENTLSGIVNSFRHNLCVTKI